MISQNLLDLRGRIALACDSVGRDPETVTLVAVSKTQPLDALKAAYDLGLRHFGESKLQEALPKIAAMPSDVVWHFIGHLQSNKARKVAEDFDAVQTLANEGQLREIEKGGRTVDGLIEVNIAEEPQKSGVAPKSLDPFFRNLIQSPCIRFRGLMTIGPALDDPEAMRPYFRALRELNQKLGGEWLSMGMSGDFEVAIQEGASHIRVGTALFGARDYEKS
jgi:hypothetical protein